MTRDRTRRLHVEPTTRCALECPLCPRTIYRQMVEIHDCDIDMVVDSCKDIDELVLVGNHGDPIYHPRFVEMLAAIRKAHPSISFFMHTNGAFRAAGFWKDLSEVLDHRDHMIFSIDGMPHDNHIYRVHSKWEHVELAVRVLRDVGCTAKLIWKWILFNYNESEVPDGIRLARDLGFDRFMLVSSSRDEVRDTLRATKSLSDIRRELDAIGISTL